MIEMADIVGDMPGKNALVGTLSSQKNLVVVVSQLSGGYARGYEEGEKEGYMNGYEIGAKEGAEVGYAKGKTDGEQNALDAFNHNLQGTGIEYAESVDEIDGKFEEAIQQQYDKGIEIGRIEGKQAEYDAFWDAYQNYGKRNQYVCAFSYGGWNDTTYNPKYPIYGYTYGLQEAFRNSNDIIDTKVPIFLQNGNMRATFNYCVSLKRIPLLVLQVPTTDTTNTFNSCGSLEEINIVCEGEGGFATNLSFAQSSKLSAESVQSIIDALVDLTGATAQTLSFHATVGAKLTQAQKDAISAKNWTLAY